MSQLFGLIRYEFNMSIRRAGMWVAYGMIFMIFVLGLNTTSGENLVDLFTGRAVFKEAAETVFVINVALPLMAGILAADRMQRDSRLNLRELQNSSPIRRGTYVFGKYLGVLLSTLSVALVCVMLHGLIAVLLGQAKPYFLLAELVAFGAIVVPSFVFVTAFSLLCPLVMPIRVYQILFTGYWFWGNFLNDKILPTISDTLLNSSGYYAAQGFFQANVRESDLAPFTPIDACLNILVLCLCSALALFTLDRYLARQARNA